MTDDIAIISLNRREAKSSHSFSRMNNLLHVSTVFGYQETTVFNNFWLTLKLITKYLLRARAPCLY